MHGYNTPVSNSFICMSWLLCRLTTNKIKMTFKKIKKIMLTSETAHTIIVQHSKRKWKTYKCKIK